MRSVAVFGDSVMVTGSSGFIGATLCNELKRQYEPHEINELPLDVSCTEEVKRMLHLHHAKTVFHLAAKGSVITARREIPEMLRVSVGGTVNLLEVVRPKRFVLASTCAVYGTTSIEGVSPNWSNVRPLSVYGMSKLTAEMIAVQWARQENGIAIIFRCGNVVGPGCRGLIDYLARHAVRAVDTREPARLRGGGDIIRDYVPVQHVVRVMTAVLNAPLRSGAGHTFNVGTGRGLSNRFVAEIAANTLRRRGFPLAIEWQAEPALGEAWTAVLNPNRTARKFDIQPPSEEEVVEAITQGTEHALARALHASHHTAKAHA